MEAGSQRAINLRATTKISTEMCDELFERGVPVDWDDFCNMNSKTDDPSRNTILEEVYAHIMNPDYAGPPKDLLDNSQLYIYYKIIKNIGVGSNSLHLALSIALHKELERDFSRQAHVIIDESH